MHTCYTCPLQSGLLFPDSLLTANQLQLVGGSEANYNTKCVCLSVCQSVSHSLTQAESAGASEAIGGQHLQVTPSPSRERLSCCHDPPCCHACLSLEEGAAMCCCRCQTLMRLPKHRSQCRATRKSSALPTWLLKPLLTSISPGYGIISGTPRH